MRITTLLLVPSSTRQCRGKSRVRRGVRGCQDGRWGLHRRPSHYRQGRGMCTILRSTRRTGVRGRRRRGDGPANTPYPRRDVLLSMRFSTKPKDPRYLYNRRGPGSNIHHRGTGTSPYRGLSYPKASTRRRGATRRPVGRASRG